MKDCIFCQIIAGEIPSNKVYEDESVLAFHDISPMAPVHVLVIPKKHISSLLAVSPEDQALIFHIMEVIQTVTKKLKIDETGFRVITNIGSDGCQSVKHLHFHVLGGKKLPESLA